MKRLRNCVGLQLLMLFWAGAATAAPSDASGATSEASAHFNRGVQLYREGNLDAALAEFVRANEIAPDFRLLYNMAQVQSERHDYVRALELLQQYFEQGGARIPTARRTEVEQEAARLRERVATLWVTADAPGAELWVNDVRMATLPLEKPVLLNAGIARVRVEAEGRKPYTGQLNVAGGDRPRLELSLEAAASTLPSTAVTPAEPVVDYTPVWISGLAAAGLGIGAITFAVVASSADSDLGEQLDTFPGNQSQIDDSRSKVRTFAALTDGFTVATVAALGVGAYFLVFPIYEGEATTEENPAEPGGDLQVSAGLGGFSLAGSV